MTEEKILYNSDDAASIKTVTGWVSSSGRFWGKEEHMARWEGCTHKLCECGNEMQKGYTICERCLSKKAIERYDKMPFKDWDGETPLVLFNDDRYFFHEEDIEMYLEDNELKPEDLRLVICEPNYLTEIEPDIWEDIWPEGRDDLPKDVKRALDLLNRIIHRQPPFSWSEGKFKTIYNP